MKINKLIVLTAAALAWQCGGSRMPADPLVETKPAKNVILMIGDGMSLTQLSAAMFSSEKPMAMEELTVTGLHKSHAHDDLTTDSGAAATAFACGIKTYKFAIGVDKDTVPCKTLMEEAEERGMATGMVVTSTIVHATPAAFVSHQPLRAYHEAIALDVAKANVDFLVGGGRRFFDQRKADNRNLVKEMIQDGYQVMDFREAPLNMINPDPVYNFIYFTSDEDPGPVMAGRDYLSYASELGVTFLRNRSRNGYFLLVEGSQIDWAGHANEAEWMIEEVKDFDEAVGRIMRYAKRRDDTLVIVTADHETGGMAIQPESTFGKLHIEFVNNEHTPQLVPLFAYGPGAELFSGVYDNTQIYYKIRQALGWGEERASR